MTYVEQPFYGGLSAPEATLDSRLRRGEPPDWLQPLDLGGAASQHINIYRVRPEASED